MVMDKKNAPRLESTVAASFWWQRLVIRCYVISIAYLLPSLLSDPLPPEQGLMPVIWYHLETKDAQYDQRCLIMDPVRHLMLKVGPDPTDNIKPILNLDRSWSGLWSNSPGGPLKTSLVLKSYLKKKSFVVILFIITCKWIHGMKKLETVLCK